MTEIKRFEEKEATSFVQECDDIPLTIRQFTEKYPWPSELGLRSYIFRAEEMNLSPAFIRVKRRVLVYPKKFFSLIKGESNCLNHGGFNEARKKQKGTAAC